MAEETANPISAAKPPVSNPMASATTVHASTLKLKPVIRKPTIGGATAVGRPGVRLPTAGGKPGLRPTAAAKPAAAPAAPAPDTAPSAVDQLKSMTAKLKGITQQIPAQAILHKTGIIADQDLTEAQKQASKSRTARISLSDAMGVAPVKNEAAPMKTIRIKRPVDIQNPSSSGLPQPAAPAPAQPAAAAPAPAEATITQRKTLKIARPGGGVRPTGKFGVKKPGATAVEKPTEGASATVADIPDIPDMPAVAPAAAEAAPMPKNRVPAVGGVMGAVGLVLQIAACGLIGFVAWLLMEAFQMPSWCGGCML